MSGGYILFHPRVASPVVIASPHSGSNYPTFVQSILMQTCSQQRMPLSTVCQARLGMLLLAKKPRAHVDLNRPRELDPALIEGARGGDRTPWPPDWV